MAGTCGTFSSKLRSHDCVTQSMIVQLKVFPGLSKYIVCAFEVWEVRSVCMRDLQGKKCLSSTNNIGIWLSGSLLWSGYIIMMGMSVATA